MSAEDRFERKIQDHDRRARAEQDQKERAGGELFDAVERGQKGAAADRVCGDERHLAEQNAIAKDLVFADRLPLRDRRGQLLFKKRAGVGQVLGQIQPRRQINGQRFCRRGGDVIGVRREPHGDLADDPAGLDDVEIVERCERIGAELGGKIGGAVAAVYLLPAENDDEIMQALAAAGACRIVAGRCGRAGIESGDAVVEIPLFDDFGHKSVAVVEGARARLFILRHFVFDRRGERGEFVDLGKRFCKQDRIGGGDRPAVRVHAGEVDKVRVFHAERGGFFIHLPQKSVGVAAGADPEQKRAVVGAAHEESAEHIAHRHGLADQIPDLIADRVLDHAVLDRQCIVHAPVQKFIRAKRGHHLGKRRGGKPQIGFVRIDDLLVFEIADRRRKNAERFRRRIFRGVGRCVFPQRRQRGQKKKQKRKRRADPFSHGHSPSLSKNALASAISRSTAARKASVLSKRVSFRPRP